MIGIFKPLLEALSRSPACIPPQRDHVQEARHHQLLDKDPRAIGECQDFQIKHLDNHAGDGQQSRVAR